MPGPYCSGPLELREGKRGNKGDNEWDPHAPVHTNPRSLRDHHAISP